jgi:hypothetical protein
MTNNAATTNLFNLFELYDDAWTCQCQTWLCYCAKPDATSVEMVPACAKWHIATQLDSQSRSIYL